MKQKLSRFQAELGVVGPSRTRQRRTLNRFAQEYLAALLNRKSAEARELIHRAVVEGQTLPLIYQRIFEPVLDELGRLWLERKISIAIEHFGSALTQRIMESLHTLVRSSEPSRGQVLLASTQDELHHIGLRMVGDLLELEGWEVVYLGSNLPANALCAMAGALRPEIVGISVTRPAHLVEVRESIRRIKQDQPASPAAILVGGYPFAMDPSLCERVGADGWALNATHAMRVARKAARSRPGYRALARRSHSASDLAFLRLSSELALLHSHISKDHTVIQELVEEKNSYLGMAAHDLRNAIQVMRTAVTLLRRSGPGAAVNESQNKLLAIIESSAKTMAELIDQYLDVSRIEAGKLELRARCVDLLKLVDERLAIARLFAEANRVTLIRTGSGAPTPCEVDPARVSQALDNFLFNAIKFSPSGGQISVEVALEGDEARISVKDQGPGIEPEGLKQLFKPFSQLRSGRGGGKEGVGLGLHIARKVIEAHGGRVWVSQCQPHGSIFFMAFPVRQSKPEQATQIAV
jgi:signal transduction histidine kinase